MNIVFDLGGVVVRWEPEAIIAKLFDDPAVRAVVRTEILKNPDWIELDRGTLSHEIAVTRAAARSGLPEHVVADFF